VETPQTGGVQWSKRPARDPRKGVGLREFRGVAKNSFGSRNLPGYNAIRAWRPATALCAACRNRAKVVTIGPLRVRGQYADVGVQDAARRTSPAMPGE
jgi:hypothetical protein